MGRATWHPPLTDEIRLMLLRTPRALGDARPSPQTTVAKALPHGDGSLIRTSIVFTEAPKRIE